MMVSDQFRISISLLLSVSAEHVTLCHALNAKVTSSVSALSFVVNNQITLTLSFLLTFIRKVGTLIGMF